MSDALEKARKRLFRCQMGIPDSINVDADEALGCIEALVNAILDAREAKADPRDARIAELERENAWLIECNGRASVRAERAEDNEEVSLRLRDQAQADAAKFLERANDLEGKYDALLTTWTESRERHLTAEAALAELRGRVEKAVEKLQWDIDHPAAMGHDRGEIIAVLTHPATPVTLLTDPDPEAKEGGGPDNDGRSDAHQPVDRGDIAQPARDTDPVPATDVEACAAVLVSAINKGGVLTLSHDTEYEVRISFGGNRTAAWSAHNAIVAIGIAIQKQRRPGWWDEFIAEARAAGITGKGTSDE